MTRIPAWLRLCTALLALALTFLASSPAHAGRRCDAARPTPQTVARSLQLAQQTADALEAQHRASGVRAVLLARAGQDLTRYGQHWSHVAWAYRSDAGPWRVVHLLNVCGSSRSVLMRQGLGEFFLDDLWRYEAAWTPVPASLEAALWTLLQDNAAVARLHQPHYSIVSYAWGTRYQQSNQWAAETLALAAEPRVAQRAQAQAWLRLQGYQPAMLHIGALTRLGGRMTQTNVAFDDHPNAQRFSDRIETVTADSLLRWLPAALQFGAVRQLALAADHIPSSQRSTP